MAVAVAGAGCATPRYDLSASIPPEQPAPIVVRDTTPPPADPVAYAADFPTPAGCEAAARVVHHNDREQGWRILKACIAKGNFTELRGMIQSHAWDHELQTRHEAPELLTQIIAARGGDTDGDVSLLHESKVPLFALSDALAQPDVYKGRLLVMRVQASEVRVRNGAATALLTEHVHGSHMIYAPVGLQDGFTSTTSGPGPGNTQHYHELRGTHARRLVDEDSETGREALGHMPAPDPFLRPDHDFIVLARFNGVTTKDDSGDDNRDSMALVDMLSYVQPATLALY
jgi:hypothetical protein